MATSKLQLIDEPGVDKWKILLAVGGVAASAFAVYYVVSSLKQKKANESKNKKEKSEERKEVTSPTLSLTIEDDEHDFELLTPLEKAQRRKNKGNKYFKGGKYEEAIKCYDEAIELCPLDKSSDLAMFYQNRAAAYEQQKNWECVLRDCTAALNHNPRYVKALQRRAKACEILDDLEQSLEDLTATCILESFQNQSTLMQVDRILKMIGRQRAKEMMSKRELFIPSKQFVKTFFQSFAEDPILSLVEKEKEGDSDESEKETKGDFKNGYMRAREHLQDGNYSEINSCCSRELSNPLTPFKAEALLLRATFDLLRMEIKSAMADFSILLSMIDVPVKIRVNALIKRGSLFMQQENVEECLKDYETAASLDPLNCDVFLHRGQVNLLTGRVEDAISDFDKAVRLNGKFAIACVQKCYTDYRLALQLGEKGRVDSSLKNLEEMSKTFPKCIEAFVLYAQALTDQEDFAKANEVYEIAQAVEPDNSTILVHRALLLVQWNGNVDEARNLINRALEMDDQCELAYENLATIEVQMGNLKRGVELFDKAIPLAKTEMEMAHLFSLKDAAVAQIKVIEKFGIQIPAMRPF